VFYKSAFWASKIVFVDMTKEVIMALVVRCKDVGFDCDGVIKAETESELMQQVAEHAKSAHGVEEVTDEIVEKVKSVITNE
jgi:predicted small metal-binding protein